MYGVVLWSDGEKNRAVIWCEDHGNLAFFKGDHTDGPGIAGIDPGDLVQFELAEEQQMRLAFNPRLVAADEYPTLAHDLRRAGPAAAPVASLPQEKSAREVSNILPFAPPGQAETAEERRRQSAG